MCQIKDGELPAMVKKRAVKIASISSDLIFQNELSNMYQFFFIVFQSYLHNKLLLRISDRTAGDCNRLKIQQDILRRLSHLNMKF